MGRSTAFISIRGADMGGGSRQAGAGTERSMISAVSVAGLWPPMIMTRGRWPSPGRSGSRTEEP